MRGSLTPDRSPSSIMRILQITEASSAGVGRHVVDLSKGLLELGCEVHLIYSPRRIDATFAAGIEGLPGLHLRPLDMRRGAHISDLLVVHQVRSYLRDQGPFDVIHGQSSKGGAIGRLAGLRHPSAMVYTPHCIFTMNPTIGKLQFHLFRAIESGLARCTDAVIAVSPDEQQHLLEIGFDRQRVRCIPNGLGSQTWADRLSLRRSLGVTEQDVVVGFLGRLCHQKNPLLMIAAFAELAPRCPNAVLVMVGQGELEEGARSLAEQHRLGKRVLWLGYWKPEEILPAFDLFALTSRYEALSYVLLEALAAGLPIVSTRVGGARLAIEPDINGSLVPSFEPRDFAAALEGIVASRDKRQHMAQASYRKAEDFLVSIMVERTYDLYTHLSLNSVLQPLR
ncbi:MAG: glycosyltransferase [Gammaproteobacteria bacterium]